LFVDRSRQLATTDYLLLLECLAISISNPSLRRSHTERHGAALVREVKEFLAGNLDKSPNLDEISTTFRISRRHLTRLFAEQTGLSVLGFIQQLRISRAKELLQHTPMSVLNVALAVGFQSPSHFAAVFSSQVRESPDNWRRQVRQTQNIQGAPAAAGNNLRRHETLGAPARQRCRVMGDAVVK
jgi:transcriptional regulator GlxA family with amidase domain